MTSVLDRLLQEHSREIAQMRVELNDKRFGLIFGAGLSKPLNFPNWKELVERIASDSEVDGSHILKTAGKNLSDTSKTQMLFQHFRGKLIDDGALAPNLREQGWSFRPPNLGRVGDQRD